MRPGWRARVAGGLKAHEDERGAVAGGETADVAPAPAKETDKPARHEPAPPARLGRYAVVRELARGGAGVVYLARDERLEREVALKLLRAGGQASAEQLSRFEVEARMAARLRHPGIVPIHEVGEAEGCPFLVMDLVQGESLAERLRREGQLAPREAARLAAEVARALAYAHARGVLHRDVKPGNVLVTSEGAALLTDFGLAKEIEGAPQGPTVTGQVMGTPSYMPPEQASGMARVDARSDVYGLGATLYDLLLGRPPYLGRDVMEVLTQVVSREPVPAPRSLLPGLDLDLDTICARCLEKDPADRYPGAAEVADDLERWLRHEPIRARRPGPLERARKWLRRNRGLARALGATVGAAGLIGVIATFGFVRRLQAEQQRADGEARIASQQAARANEQAARASEQAALASQQAALASAQAERARQQAAVAGRAMQVLIHEVRARLVDLPGREVAEAREAILLRAIAGLEELDAAELADDDRTLEAVEAWCQVGDVRELSGQGRLTESVTAYQRAVELARRMSRPDSYQARFALMKALLSLSQGLREIGRLDEAVAAGQEAVTHARWLAETPLPATRDPTVHVNVLRYQAVAEERLGMALSRQYRLAPAEEHLQAAVATERAVIEAEHHPRDQLPLAITLGVLGSVQTRARAFARALQSLEESRDLILKVLERAPDMKTRLHLLETLQQLGDVRTRQNERESARQALEQALTLGRALVAETPSFLLARSRVAELQSALADLERRPERALPRLQEAATLLRDVSAQSPAASTHAYLAWVLDKQTRVQLELGAVSAARASAEEAIALRRRIPAGSDGQEADDLAGSLDLLGRVRLSLVDLEPARAAFQEAIALRRAWLDEHGADRPAAASETERGPFLRGLGRSLLYAGDVERAASDLEAAAARYEEARALLAAAAERDPEAVRGALGEALARQAALAEQRASGAPAGDPLEARLALDPVDPASADSLRARVRLLQGLALERLQARPRPGSEPLVSAARLLDEAEQRLGTLLALPEAGREDRELMATTVAMQADRLLCAGQLPAALEAFRRGVGLQREVVAAGGDARTRRDLALVLERVGEVARKAGQPRESVTALEESLALRRELLAADPGSVVARRDLSAALAGLVNVRQVLNDVPGAVQALTEAVENHRLLVQRAPQYEPELIQMESGLRQLRARLKGGEAPASGEALSSREQLRLGYALLERGADPQAAAVAFRAALADPENCADLRQSNLYNGACAAALAARAAAEGSPERAAFLKDAWTWLEDDLERHGRLLERVQQKLAEPDLPATHRQELGSMVDFCRRHFAHARQDADLELLRADAARFQRAFPANSSE